MKRAITAAGIITPLCRYTLISKQNEQEVTMTSIMASPLIARKLVSSHYLSFHSKFAQYLILGCERITWDSPRPVFFHGISLAWL